MAKLPLETLLWRSLKLRCPRCGKDRLFRGLFHMQADCSACGLHYEREPGYFLGSAYINYGLTALLLTASYIGLHVMGGISNRVLAWPLGAFAVLFPLFFFRYARALWLGFDLYFDSSGPESSEPSGGTSESRCLDKR